MSYNTEFMSSSVYLNISTVVIKRIFLEFFNLRNVSTIKITAATHYTMSRVGTRRGHLVEVVGAERHRESHRLPHPKPLPSLHLPFIPSSLLPPGRPHTELSGEEERREEKRKGEERRGEKFSVRPTLSDIT